MSDARPGQRRGPVTSSIVAGAGVALALGCTDLLVAVAPGPPEFHRATNAVKALGVDMIVAAGVFLIARLLAWVTWRRNPGVGTFVAASATVLLGFVVAVSSPENMFLGYYDCQRDALVCPPYLIKAMIIAAAFTPMLVLALARGVRTGSPGVRADDVVLYVTPALLAEAVACEWIFVYNPASLSGLWHLAIAAAGIGVIAATAALATRARVVRHVPTVAALLAATTVAAGGLLAADEVRAWDGAVTAAARPLGQGLPVRHVLLITIDTLRADALTGDDRERKAPRITKFSERAAVFTRAQSPSSWTLPTVGSWLTGTSPAVHRLGRNQAIARSFLTLPERMREAGYHTAAVLGTPFLDQSSGTRRGFDEFVVLVPPQKDLISSTSFGYRLWLRFRAARRPKGTTTTLTDRAVAWLTQHASEPTFLWVHYLDPHSPCTPPPEFLASSGTATGGAAEDAAAGPLPHPLAEARRCYEAEVRYVDANVGRLLDTAESLGMADDSLIVLSADHGDEFGEHGAKTPQHGHSLYQELLHVPLIVKLSHAARANRIDEPVSTQSLYTTIPDLCGLRVESTGFEAPSIAALVRGQSTTAPYGLFTSWLLGLGEERAAVFSGSLKYIHGFDSGREELYDLAADPTEQSSLMSSRPDDVRRLREFLRAVLASNEAGRARFGTGRPDAVDPERQQQLKALGYIR
jgi:arylsulfatase A-like enzyme